MSEKDDCDWINSPETLKKCIESRIKMGQKFMKITTDDGKIKDFKIIFDSIFKQIKYDLKRLFKKT